MPTDRKSDPQHTHSDLHLLAVGQLLRAWPLPSPPSGETLLYLELMIATGRGCPAELEKLARPRSPPLRTKVCFLGRGHWGRKEN